VDTKTKKKIAGFLALLVLYFVIAGSDVGRRMVWRLMLVYVTGASVAFWAGSDPIGTFRPITMRPLCIFIGSVMMIYGLSMTLFVKEVIHKNDRAPNTEIGRKVSSTPTPLLTR